MGNIGNLLATRTAQVRLLDDAEIRMLAELEESLVKNYKTVLLREKSIVQRLKQLKDDKDLYDQYSQEMTIIIEHREQLYTLLFQCWRTKMVASYRKTLQMIVEHRPKTILPSNISLIREFTEAQKQYSYSRAAWQEYLQYVLENHSKINATKAPIPVLKKEDLIEEVIAEKNWFKQTIIKEISETKKRIEGLKYMEEWCQTRSLLHQENISEIQDRLDSINEIQDIEVLLPIDISLERIEAAIDSVDEIAKAESEVEQLLERYVKRRTQINDS